jgi:glucokinase
MSKQHLMAVDIGATKTALTIMDSHGEPLLEEQLPSNELFLIPESSIASLAQAISNSCRQRGIKAENLKGIAVGIPGVMDWRTQTVASCPNLPELNGLPLGTQLSRLLGVPVYVDKDTNFLALGELTKGCGKDVDNFACIYVGSGIGCGIILDGKLYRGSDGAAGELGHTIIEPNGKHCTCGNQGCLEMYCSGKALAIQANEILEQSHLGRENPKEQNNTPTGRWDEAEQVIAAAKDGNSSALQAIETAFFYLGLGVTNLVNILNLRRVILGGGIINGWPDGVSIVSRVVKIRARTVVREHLSIVQAVLGQEASYVGSYAYIENMLSK